jgi:hypothetical protein
MIQYALLSLLLIVNWLIQDVPVHVTTATHRPNWKDVTIRRIRNSNGPVENASNAFLWPISAWKLTLDEILYSTTYSVNIGTFGHG